ncbi:AAA family ATPase [Rhodobacteraceae bacterium R_SAG6]|nr:AAA family ATPase [Rhodobacteraceae bacterium R_SAG6]
MLSISPVSAGAAASGYYKQEGYYKEGSDEGKQAATWFGKTAEELGLNGFIDDKQFAQFLDGESPDGELMGRHINGERKHRPGIDLTFSASKSASVAAFVIGDQRVIDAHDAAVRTAMKVVEERFVKTRFQQDGEITTKNAEGIIAGIYRHDTSRALDPNLHSHAVITNIAKNEEGGYTAIRNEDIYNNRKLITEIYRSDFENSMREQGIATERGRYGEVNISGIPQEVTEAFSKRRQEILKAMEGKGIDYSPETASKAALATRAVKHKDLDRDALRAEWRAEGLAAGLTKDQLDKQFIENSPTPATKERPSSPQLVAPMKPEYQQAEPAQPGAANATLVSSVVGWMKNLIATPQVQHSEPARAAKTAETPEGTAVTKAIQHVSERSSVYERSELAAAALRFSQGIGISKIDEEIDRLITAKELFSHSKDGEHLTDKETVATEGSILKTWRKGEKAPSLNLGPQRGVAGVVDLADRLSKEETMTAGQREAIDTSLSGTGRYVGVQGLAGSGKTYMAQKLSEIAAEGGYSVKGYAPTLQAVNELNKVVDSAATVASIVSSERNYPQKVGNSRSILLVDEASMLSAKDMRSFMDYAERTKAARVVFVGDTKQLDAVSAGQPFAQMQEAGMRTAVMDEIQRQRDGNLKAAVYDAVRGDIAGAFDKLQDSIEKADNPRQAAADKYLALSPEDRSETRILTLNNTARAEINGAVREGLKAEGSLSQDGLSVQGLVPRPMTSVEKSDSQNYAPGDVVQPIVDNREVGLQRNTLYRIEHVDHATNTLSVERETDGERISIPLAAQAGHQPLGASLVAYQNEAREISTGEAVRVRITDKDQGLTNGTRATVTSTENGVITLSTRDGRSVEIEPQSLGARGLEHDYAATAHSVQGETVDRVIVSMNSGDRMATQKGFYVEISRARDEAVLITDNRVALARNIAENTGVQVNALSNKLDGFFQKPEVDAVRAVTRAVEHTSERESAYLRTDLATAALKFSIGSNFEDVDKEINSRIEDGRLFVSRDDNRLLTDKASVELERSIIATWMNSRESAGLELNSYRNRSGDSTLKTQLTGLGSMTDGQKDAIYTSLSGDDRYVGVQGFAGTGKTVMMQKLAHYAEQNGYAVKGMAPSHQAVHELASVLGSAETLAKNTTAERHHPEDVDNSKTILVVDEASMASAKEMRDLMDYAERTGSPRVVFVGDTQQLDAVAAGQPFAQLQKAGMRTAVMDDIRRQRDVDLKEAVYHSIRGEIQPALDRLDGNVLEVDDPRAEAADRYLSLPPEVRDTTRILTLTNAARSEINEAVREGMWKEGTLTGEEVTVQGLSNQQLTEAQLADARSYAVGTRVMPVATSEKFGLVKNNVYVVSQSDPERNRITVTHEETGEKSILPLEAKFNQRELGKSLVAYDPEQREVAAGDQVRFRITDKESGITNGLRAVINSTSGGVIEATGQDGSNISLPINSVAARGLEHDYAATAHAVQGESVDRVIIAMRSTERLATQKAFYVEISRARDEAVLLTDDPEKLSKTIEDQTGIRSTALDTWMDGRLIGVRDLPPPEDKSKDQPEKTPEPEKGKETKDKDQDTPYLPGIMEDKIKEVEKQAEIVLQRERGIER